MACTDLCCRLLRKRKKASAPSKATAKTETIGTTVLTVRFDELGLDVDVAEGDRDVPVEFEEGGEALGTKANVIRHALESGWQKSLHILDGIQSYCNPGSDAAVRPDDSKRMHVGGALVSVEGLLKDKRAR